MHSDLNPEAPEFCSRFTQLTKINGGTYNEFKDINPKPLQNKNKQRKKGYSAVNKTIRTSNQLPAGASHEMFKTFTNFNIVKSKLSENVVEQSNGIAGTELPTVKLKVNELEHNTEKVVDVNDSLLDRANINIDTESGVNKPNMPTNWRRRSSFNNRPTVSRARMGYATLMSSEDIPRPQLKFKDIIDNSDNMWVPKITYKPHSMRSLEACIIYNDVGKIIGYKHPYELELEQYEPPIQFLAPDPKSPVKPPPLADTKLTMVETETQLDVLIKHLEGVKEMAIDVEHHSYRTYLGLTCLIQLTTDDGGDFLIDVLAIREHVYKLNEIFTDPSKLKVLHGADSDVIWLQRDFGVYLVGVFDTYRAASILNMSALSLKHLMWRYCDVDIDKRYQLADWRVRPLPEDMQAYARTDTHYLLYIYRVMKAKLLEIGNKNPHLVQAVYEQTRSVCAGIFRKKKLREDSHLDIYKSSQKTFNTRQMAALKVLFKWRDEQARLIDESPVYVIPSHMLVSLAEILPREVQGVRALCSPMPTFVKKNMLALHRLLLTCREMPLEPQLDNMPSSIRTMADVSQQLASTHQVHDLLDPSDDSDPNATIDTIEYFNSKLTPDPATSALRVPGRSYSSVVAGLNVDAKSFIPPFDRHKEYRCLAQAEEMKEFKEKEAKVAALGQGDELIKAEVLAKVQEAKEEETKIEKEAINVKVKNSPKVTFNADVQKNAKRNKNEKKENIAEMKKNAEVVISDDEPQKAKLIQREKKGSRGKARRVVDLTKDDPKESPTKSESTNVQEAKLTQRKKKEITGEPQRIVDLTKDDPKESPTKSEAANVQEAKLTQRKKKETTGEPRRIVDLTKDDPKESPTKSEATHVPKTKIYTNANYKKFNKKETEKERPKNKKKHK